MSWLKQNLFLVVSGIVALGLLGGAGYFLYSKMEQEKQIDGEWKTRLGELERLAQKNLQRENIDAAKEEQKRLEELVKEFDKRFTPIPYIVSANNFQFKTNLDSTLFHLEQAAEAAHVTLRERESFSFTAIKDQVQFDAGALLPLSVQLAEVKTICETLFNAKVHSLDDLRRVAVSKQEQTTSADYLANKQNQTNGNVVISPYQVTFRGFSSELAAVMNGFVGSPHCFLVKSINVEASVPVSMQTPSTPAPVWLSPSVQMPAPSSRFMQESRGRYSMAPGLPGGPGAGMDPMMMSRYGLGPYSRRPPAPETPGTVFAAPPNHSSVTNLLDEKPLKVTLALEIVKLKPEGTKGKAGK